MLILIRLGLVIFLMIMGKAAWAFEFDEGIEISSYRIVLSHYDDVTGGCWTNANELISLAKGRFAENGIIAQPRQTIDPHNEIRLDLSVYGGRVAYPGGYICLVSCTLELQTIYFNERMKGLNLGIIAAQRNVLGYEFNGRKKINNSIRQVYLEFVDKIIMRIMKEKVDKYERSRWALVFKTYALHFVLNNVA